MAKHIVITGGAGFVGSHLVDRHIEQGHQVTVIDNLFTGTLDNLEQWKNHQSFKFFNFDLASVKLEEILSSIKTQVHEVYHLACPASPDQYWRDPIFTMKTGFLGTLVMLEFSTEKKAKFLTTSTSEVYGDPLLSPQPQTYFGNVNIVGPRACYDEAKRIAETLCYEFGKKIHVRIARLFNTFGPRLSIDDGRVVSNFIVQALQQKPLTVYGDGKQTRSLIYVSDTIDGLMLLMNSDVTVPVNIGGSEESSVLEIGKTIWKLIRKEDPKYQYLQARQDDPRQRKPDTTRAQELLQWKQKVSISEGLQITLKHFKNALKK